MEIEEGIVLKIHNGKAVIQMENCSECQTCGAKHACISLSNESARQIEIPVTKEMNQINEGDKIRLSFKPQSRIFSAFLVFILPILVLIASYFIGMKIFGTEGKAILSGFCGLLVTFVLIRLIDKLLVKENSFMPTIQKIDI